MAPYCLFVELETTHFQIIKTFDKADEMSFSKVITIVVRVPSKSGFRNNEISDFTEPHKVVINSFRDSPEVHKNRILSVYLMI